MPVGGRIGCDFDLDGIVDEAVSSLDNLDVDDDAVDLPTTDRDNDDDDNDSCAR